MDEVHFYYGLGSRYSYIAATQVSIPYREPNVEGVDWSQVIRACIAARSMGEVERYSLAVYEDVFADANPPRSAEQLIAIATKLGLDAARFGSLLGSEVVDESRRLRTHRTPACVAALEPLEVSQRVRILVVQQLQIGDQCQGITHHDVRRAELGTEQKLAIGHRLIDYLQTDPRLLLAVSGYSFVALPLALQQSMDPERAS